MSIVMQAAEADYRIALIRSTAGVTAREARRRYAEAIAPSTSCHVSSDRCWRVYEQQILIGIGHVEALCSVNEFVREEIERKKMGF